MASDTFDPGRLSGNPNRPNPYPAGTVNHSLWNQANNGGVGGRTPNTPRIPNSRPNVPSGLSTQQLEGYLKTAPDMTLNQELRQYTQPQPKGASSTGPAEVLKGRGEGPLRTVRQASARMLENPTKIPHTPFPSGGAAAAASVANRALIVAQFVASSKQGLEDLSNLGGSISEGATGDRSWGTAAVATAGRSWAAMGLAASAGPSALAIAHEAMKTGEGSGFKAALESALGTITGQPTLFDDAVTGGTGAGLGQGVLVPGSETDLGSTGMHDFTEYGGVRIAINQVWLKYEITEANPASYGTRYSVKYWLCNGSQSATNIADFQLFPLSQGSCSGATKAWPEDGVFLEPDTVAPPANAPPQRPTQPPAGQRPRAGAFPTFGNIGDILGRNLPAEPFIPIRSPELPLHPQQPQEAPKPYEQPGHQTQPGADPNTRPNELPQAEPNNTPGPNGEPAGDDRRFGLPDVIDAIGVGVGGATAIITADLVGNESGTEAKAKEQPKAGPVPRTKPGNCGCNPPLIAHMNKQHNELLEKFGLAGANAAGEAASTATIMGKLNQMQQFAEKAWEATRMQKVLDALTFIAVMHNVAMLSRNVGDTFFELISQGLNVIGIEDENGSPLDVNGMVSGGIESFLRSVLGNDVYEGTRDTWNKASRILSSASMVIWTVRSLADTSLDLTEWIGENVSKIGNALKAWGVVGENSYRDRWMSERAQARNRIRSKFDRITGALDATEERVETFTIATSAVVELQDETGELAENFGRFKDSVENGIPDPWVDNVPVATEQGNAKTVSQSPNISASDAER